MEDVHKCTAIPFTPFSADFSIFSSYAYATSRRHHNNILHHIENLAGLGLCCVSQLEQLSLLTWYVDIGNKMADKHQSKTEEAHALLTCQSIIS